MAKINFDDRLKRLEKRRKAKDLSYNLFDSIGTGITSYSEFTSLQNKPELWENIQLNHLYVIQLELCKQ